MITPSIVGKHLEEVEERAVVDADATKGEQ
jgi:hypothetical protein